MGITGYVHGYTELIYFEMRSNLDIKYSHIY